MTATAPGAIFYCTVPLQPEILSLPIGSAISWHCPIVARPFVTAVLRCHLGISNLHRVLGGLVVLMPLFLPILPDSTVLLPMPLVTAVVTLILRVLAKFSCRCSYRSRCCSWINLIFLFQQSRCEFIEIDFLLL